jgi:hypothetical protein
MMTDQERRKVFWLLKKWSSYTAWRKWGEAYAKFVNAWERAMKLADKTDIDEFNMEAMKDLWNGKRGFDKGLPLLKRGERGVFRYRADGYLGWHAVSAIGIAQRLMDPVEYVFDWMKNKDEVIEAWNKVSQFMCGVGRGIEPGNPVDNAPFGSKTILNEDFYGPFNFPLDLPDVPTSTDVIINSGEVIPFDGIWEPEWKVREARTNFLSNLINVRSSNTEQFEKGCMNYLMADTIAPTYKDGLGEPEIQVVWRLIWEDTRYRDGIIPEEESQYLAPPAVVTSPQANDKLRGQPGEVVPETGWWHTPALQGSVGMRHFTRGEHFPEQKTSQWGDIIWTYDAEQQPPK